MSEVVAVDRSFCKRPYRKRNGLAYDCWPTDERPEMPNDSDDLWSAEELNTEACDDAAFSGMDRCLCTWRVFADRCLMCRVEGTVRKAGFLWCEMSFRFETDCRRG